MDTVDYADANQVWENCQAYRKRMRHLSSWILLLLSPFTSCTNNEVTVETCIHETASFKWDYEVPPFYAVEWYFGKTQIAETLEEHLLQDSLSIKDNYKSRFVLLEEDKIGFSLTNVKKDDDGDYKCILTTDVLVEKKWTLNVKDPVEQKSPCKISGKEGQPSATDSPGTANHVAVPVVTAVIVAIVVIAVIAVIAGVAFVVIRKKRKSAGENQYFRSEAEPRSEFESRELVEQKDKIKSPAENGEESQDLVENKEA